VLAAPAGGGREFVAVIRRDRIGELWYAQREWLALARWRNGLDLRQAMEEYEQNEAELGEVPQFLCERRRLDRVAKLRNRAAASQARCVAHSGVGGEAGGASRAIGVTSGR
jgi:hypothetical protein